MLHDFVPAYFHWWHIPFLFTAGLIGESYGSLVGGGSFITQPALLIVGAPLKSVLAIDAAAPIATELGIFSETKDQVLRSKRLVMLMAIPLLLGGIVGTWLLLSVSPDLIKYLMIASVVVILGHTHFSSGKREVKPLTKSNYALLFVFLFIVSMYSNFIGLGEGTFGRLAIMAVLGMSFVDSTGIKATATIPARLYSLIVTGLVGLIVWPYIITLWCADFLAAKYAIRFVKKIPDHYLRITTMVISVLFVIYLVFLY